VGVILYASDPGGLLYRIDPAGGGATPVTTRRDEGQHRNPIFLPDGRHFFFNASRTIFLGDVETGVVRELIEGAFGSNYAPPGFVFFMQPRSGGALFAQRFDPIAPQLLDESRSLIEGIYTGTGRPRYTVSATGLLAYLAQEEEGVKLWMDRRVVELARKAVPDDAAGWMFRISPSGNEVAFSGWGSGVLELERSIFQAEHLGPSRSATEVPDMVAGRITDCRSDAGAA